MGTIGTAPELEALSALTPFDHGGNMDVPDVKPGNTVYLPVRVPGALFFTGDCHAGQGQGELCGVALEITARVTLTFDLIKQRPIAWPRIESPDELMTVGSARPMEDAARIAYTELIEWMIELGWDRLELTRRLPRSAISTSAIWSTPTTPSSPRFVRNTRLSMGDREHDVMTEPGAKWVTGPPRFLAPI